MSEAWSPPNSECGDFAALAGACDKEAWSPPNSEMGDFAALADACSEEEPTVEIRAWVEKELERSVLLSWVDTEGEAEGLEAEVALLGDEEALSQPPPDVPLQRRPLGPGPAGSAPAGSGSAATAAGLVEGLPPGRRLLLALAGRARGGREARSAWLPARTLDERGAEPSSSSSSHCPGPSEEAQERPGCRLQTPAPDGDAQPGPLSRAEVTLRVREQDACRMLRKRKVEPLPLEALEWDKRECALWFLTDGAFHPRSTLGEHRTAPQDAARAGPGGPEGLDGKRGRVSVVTPTIESRQHFHASLWGCFQAQTWPNKELIVVETYSNESSEFFAELAKKDSRVVYVKFRRPVGGDWSIGLKRNLGAHLATGEFIANFDDDDLYAPEYLSTMVSQLEKPEVQAVTLSSWFILDVDRGRPKVSFCDPVAWGLAFGKSESSDDVKSALYGYGFSYVFRRRAGLDIIYEDINLGEDYKFVMQLRQRRGRGSVALFHDDFGICLHVQHGGNTSDSMPLRRVGQEEALSLDVAALAGLLAQRAGPAPAGEAASRATAAQAFLALAGQPSCRSRLVHVQLPDRDLHVECTVSSTADEIRELVQEQALEACDGLQVYRVPPRGEASEETREAAAVEALGLGFLLEVPEVAMNVAPEGRCHGQWRQLLDQALRPLAGRDRLGLRAKELWLWPAQEEPSDDAAPSLEGGGAENAERCINVTASCLKSSAQHFFSASGTLVARLPLGSRVYVLRWLLGTDLPEGAKVLAERPGHGLVPLDDREMLPERVTLTEFTGQRTFYMAWSRQQKLIFFSMTKEFFMNPEVQSRLDELQESVQGNENRYKIAICKILIEETYPPILRRFDVPEDQISMSLVKKCTADAAGDLEISAIWFESEVVMRNGPQIRLAHYWVCENCKRLGYPLPDYDGWIGSLRLQLHMRCAEWEKDRGPGGEKAAAGCGAGG